MYQQSFSRNVQGKKYIYNVPHLIEESKNLEVIEVNLEDIKEIDTNIWNYLKYEHSIRKIVSVMERVLAADLSYPIILAPDGALMDGGHRIAKSLHLNKKTIKAVKFKEYPQPNAILDGDKLQLRSKFITSNQPKK